MTTKLTYFLAAFIILVLAACTRDEALLRATAVTIQPTTTATHTPTIIFDETAVIRPLSNFKLTALDAQTLIQLRMDPYQMPLSFADGLNLNPIMLPEPLVDDPIQMTHHQSIIENFFPLLENDLQQHYPREISGASVYLFRHDELANSGGLYLICLGVALLITLIHMVTH